MNRFVFGFAGRLMSPDGQFLGTAGAGKNAVSETIFAANDNVRFYSIGDPIKHAIQALFGLSYEETWEDSLKNTVLPDWGVTPRRLAQLFGTDCIRKQVSQNFWTERAAKIVNGDEDGWVAFATGPYTRQKNMSYVDESSVSMETLAKWRARTAASILLLCDPNSLTTPFCELTSRLEGMAAQCWLGAQPNADIEQVMTLTGDDLNAAILDFRRQFDKTGRRTYVQLTLSPNQQKMNGRTASREITVIPDIRFDDERRFVDGYGHNGVMIHVVRQAQNLDFGQRIASKDRLHASERELPVLPQDFLFDNQEGALPEAEAQMSHLLSSRFSPSEIAHFFQQSESTLSPM